MRDALIVRVLDPSMLALLGENPGPVGLVGKGGLEPPISGVSDRRSHQLNYLPIVLQTGIEPV